jgi:hypothetical protein
MLQSISEWIASLLPESSEKNLFVLITGTIFGVTVGAIALSPIVDFLPIITRRMRNRRAELPSPNSAV